VDLNGKVAVITGGASGVGAATAQRLAELGAVIVVADVDDRRGEQLTGELGERHLYRHLDVGDLQGWGQLLEEVTREAGGVDIVHLNAGVMTRPAGSPALDDPMTSFTESAYRRMTAVNVDGVVFGIMAALPHLEARGGGDIVVTASTAGLTPLAVDPLYALSKHALVGLVRSLGPTLEARGVRVNAVCPGGIDTAIVPPDLRARGTFSPPSYIADVVVEILESNESGVVWVAPGESVGAWRVDPHDLTPSPQQA
jgi:NAD(P)-dependent dehydrogenase (short-subunit alcohol dehydrogenase family)